MVNFRLFGIPVVVQPWHWILLALLGFSWGGGSPMRAALFVLAGFFSILVHEMGHALTGRAFKCQPHIILHGFGGLAAFPGATFTRPQSFLVTAAGPAAQFLLGLIALGLFLGIRESLPETDIRYFFEFLIIISLFWSILNLVPIFPLDGGQLLDSLLGPKRRNLTLTISILAAVGVAAGMYFKFGSWLFPLLILMAAFQNFSELKERTSKKE